MNATTSPVRFDAYLTSSPKRFGLKICSRFGIMRERETGSADNQQKAVARLLGNKPGCQDGVRGVVQDRETRILAKHHGSTADLPSRRCRRQMHRFQRQAKQIQARR